MRRIPNISTPFTAALALVVLFPELSHAQRLEAGIGWGPTSAERVSGTALYAKFTVPTGLTIARAEVEVTGFGTRGSGSGSYFACEQVQQFYCTGRRDTHASLGVEVGARFFWPGADRQRGLYILLPGPSILRRTRESVEYQAPTGLCFDGTDFISCPDNPPFQTFRKSESEWAFGLTSGAGFAFRLAGMESFIEARFHTTSNTGFRRASGHVPLIFGVRF